VKSFLVRETWRSHGAERRYDAETAEDAAVAAARHFTPVVSPGEARFEDYYVQEHGARGSQTVRIRFEYRLSVEACR
jgi:hypothetical protein